MPLPMMPLTTIIVADRRPSSRRRAGCGRGPACGRVAAGCGRVTPRPRATRGVAARSRQPATRASYDQQLPLVLPRRHHRPLPSRVRVHLAAHADVAGDVDAGLDREGDTGDEAALLARLEVVDVRARAVQVARVDRVAGAMGEVLAEPA